MAAVGQARRDKLFQVILFKREIFNNMAWLAYISQFTLEVSKYFG